MSSYADLLNVLYEDNHCLALDKPAGWPSAHAEGDEQTRVLGDAKRWPPLPNPKGA